MCWNERQATPDRSTSASIGITVVAADAIAEPSVFVRATMGQAPSYRETASSVSTEPPPADTATTTVPGRGRGQQVAARELRHRVDPP